VRRGPAGDCIFTWQSLEDGGGAGSSSDKPDSSAYFSITHRLVVYSSYLPHRLAIRLQVCRKGTLPYPHELQRQAGDDGSCVRLVRNPAPAGAEARTNWGHTSASGVSGLSFLHDDRRLVSIGGTCVFVWRYVRKIDFASTLYQGMHSARADRSLRQSCNRGKQPTPRRPPVESQVNCNIPRNRRLSLETNFFKMSTILWVHHAHAMWRLKPLGGHFDDAQHQTSDINTVFTLLSYRRPCSLRSCCRPDTCDGPLFIAGATGVMLKVDEWKIESSLRISCGASPDVDDILAELLGALYICRAQRPTFLASMSGCSGACMCGAFFVCVDRPNRLTNET